MPIAVSGADAASTVSTISGATRVYFIIGDPIAQVKSPEGVTRAMRSLGHDAIVVPIHVSSDDLPAFFASAARMKNVDGIIVTVPHKFSAVGPCTTLSAEAEFLGAANMLRRTADGNWHGGMCDGAGFVAALVDGDYAPHGKRALLVGAGGAGSAIGHALMNAGISSLDIRDSDEARTTSLTGRLNALQRGEARRVLPNVEAHTYDIVVNASPLGMRADDPLPIDVSRLPATTLVGDVVTKPPLTPLIEAARARGCLTVTGLQMFDRVCDRMVEFLLDSAVSQISRTQWVSPT
ncbi:shikimate dehydrogenase family protein [Pararobbsia alpina]|nr:shikimate dehydrogenase [Pararobbsia alpina]